MIQLKIKGPQIGSDLGTVAATVAGSTGTTAVPSFIRPAPVSGLPRISGTFDGNDLTVDTTGLTPTAYLWRLFGGETISTAPSIVRSFTLATQLQENPETSVVVNETIPADTPASGTIRITLIDGTVKTITYDSYSGSTFTISDPTATFGIGSLISEVGSSVKVLGLGGQYIECVVTSGGQDYTSPPIMVYARGMDAAHGVNDQAVLAIAPHPDATHIAVQDGNWNTAATWSTGTVPKYGSVVLIPFGLTVKYDVTDPNIRLDRVRVDGRLWVDAANTTTEQYKMLVETLVITRNGDFEIGTAANRMPDTADFTLTVSGKDYSSASYTPTNMKSGRFLNTRGWERGVIIQGRGSFWGAQKLTWAKADPTDVGATSLTLHEVPTGLAVGDTIVIGGTDTVGAIWEDEERVVTGISGNLVSWSGGLSYPHKNQLVGSTRTDLCPAVLVKGNKNITFRSEVTSPNYRRGHFVYMHHHCIVDAWDIQCIDMGRTDKDNADPGGDATIFVGPGPTGVVNENGEFETCNPNTEGGTVATSALSSDANLQSRYPFHLHHVGFNHSGTRPIVNNIYVGDTPGWGIVHHACDADFVKTAVYKSAGCGMVSESGNEVGAWIDCLVMHTTHSALFGTNSQPKLMDLFHKYGERFRRGYGFGYMGRAMRVSRCVAVSCTWGHVFHHRAATDLNTNPIDFGLSPSRSTLDLRGTGMLQYPGGWLSGGFGYNEYPIVHFADCESIACFGGLSITKELFQQGHDVSVKFKRFKAYGFRFQGIHAEYVATYIFDQIDLVAGQANRNGALGLSFDTNTYQMNLINSRVEGCGVAHYLSQGLFSNGTASQDDPRFSFVGAETIDCLTVTDVGPYQGGASFAASFFERDDFDGTLLDFDLDPSHTYPRELITIDGTNTITFQASNADGKKISNQSSLHELMPKNWPSGDEIFVSTQTTVPAMQQLAVANGYWEYDGGFCILTSDVISDPLTGRPSKHSFIAKAANAATWVGASSNGALTFGSPVSVSNLSVVVQAGVAKVVDVITDASPTGGDGVTYVLDANSNKSDFLKPDHGIASINETTGEITYTPDENYLGTDEMYVFVKSGDRYGTVRINFLVTEDGLDSGLTIPAVDTHFAASDGGSRTIDVELFDQPDVSGRRIKLVQYSTDAGATWRRLCHGWVKATHSIAVESDGTAIAAGICNVRIRYRTDYDFVFSTASGDDAVTAT